MSLVVKSNEDWLKLTYKDISKEFIYQNFADGEEDAPHNFNDVVTLSNIPAESPLLHFNLIDVVETTKGRIVAHIFLYGALIEKYPKLGPFPFHNGPFTKKVAGGIDDYFSKLFIDTKITAIDVDDYINRFQWLGFILCTFAAPSLDYDTLVVSDTVEKYKEKVFKENDNVFKNNDVLKFSAIEKDIVNYTMDDMRKKKASGIQIYDSGWNGDPYNNLKNTSLFRGVAPTSYDPSKFVISKSNLVEGVKREDMVAHADIAVAGSAGRAIDTAVGGYEVKKFNSAFAHMLADKRGSDCGTLLTRKVFIDKDALKFYKRRYVQEGTKTVLLNETHLNKTVNLRTPMYCKGKKYCNKCLGDSLYNLNIKNIGLNTSRISSVIMYKSMKSFHNMAVKPQKIDFFKYVSPYVESAVIAEDDD